MNDSSFHVAADDACAPPIHDIVGIGFGPANLALAVAGRARGVSGMKFFERSPAFEWHPGMMLDGARMQISFLKDLSTLRDPASEFTFLKYVQAMGRLESFVNLRSFYPTRAEFLDYLNWAAGHFADQVDYGVEVTRVTLWPASTAASPLFCLHLRNVATRKVETCLARSVVNAPGGTPRFPGVEIAKSPRVFHSSEFLPRIESQFPVRDRPLTFAVIGGGQSAGEIAVHLLDRYPSASVHMLINDYAPRPADDSPFVNQQFQSDRIHEFHGLSAEDRRQVRADLSGANYAVMEPEIIERLYRHVYDAEVGAERRFFLHSYADLCRIRDCEPLMEVEWKHRHTGVDFRGRFDAVVLATGYTRRLDEAVFADILPHVRQDELGGVRLTTAHRVETSGVVGGGLYVQGLGEHSFGIADSLLSALPFRAHAILDDIAGAASPPAPPAPKGEYPPRRHVEDDPEQAYSVMEHFPFATVVSVSDAGEPLMTHAPLILDRTKGPRGVLFGHMDRANPQTAALLNGPILACFHGPNAYISPSVYTSDQLPTWNSISVHVRGRARIITDNAELVRGLCSISSTVDRTAYRLDPDDRRIGQLIDYIVGFEVEIEEIVGRFKLSQDRSDVDRRLAASELLRHTSDALHAPVRAYLAVEDPVPAE